MHKPRSSSVKPASLGILFPIKPVYAQRILAGEKRYEFRRVTPLRPVGWIAIYSTTPDQAIVGYASVRKILTGSPKSIWRSTSPWGGIPLALFNAYFAGTTSACAIEVEQVVKLAQPLLLKRLDVKLTPPQSFRYLPPDLLLKLQRQPTA